MKETSNTPEYDKFRRRCLDAVEGMKFFDHPVQDMTAEELLVVVGHLVTENVRLQKTDYAFQSKLANDITDAFLERRWIPMSERRPPDGEDVLAYDPRVPDDDSIALLSFNSSSGVWSCPCAREGDPAYCYEPTHWMPLPAPPMDGK